jgi:hypothetical protein
MPAIYQWQARASEALVLAGTAATIIERELLIDIASAYDRLARINSAKHSGGQRERSPSTA